MNYQTEINRISQWMDDYARNANSKGYVIGLSGGIDSSVMACLCVNAVGVDNVIGVSLPCETRQDMKDDAEELAKNLGIKFEKINLIYAFDLLLENMHQECSQLTQANMKARLRMTALYAVANQNNYLVAGTGNLSELMIGYCTKGGDGLVDIEPLGNYYKEEVYKIAELMPDIPNRVKTKAPSADLWSGQTDEEELGMTYNKLDKILKALNDGNHKVLDSLPINQITKIQKMIKQAEHKNNVPPRYER